MQGVGGGAGLGPRHDVRSGLLNSPWAGVGEHSRSLWRIIWVEDKFSMFDLSGRGAVRAEDAQESPSQSHISPSILVCEENRGGWEFRASSTLPGRGAENTPAACGGV